MTEVFLNSLSVKQLYELLIQSISEMTAMHASEESPKNIQAKHDEIDLIHKIIKAKKNAYLNEDKGNISSIVKH